MTFSLSRGTKLQQHSCFKRCKIYACQDSVAAAFYELSASSPIYAGFYINAIRFIPVGGFMTVDLHAKALTQSKPSQCQCTGWGKGGQKARAGYC